jgi:hypothetical protein
MTDDELRAMFAGLEERLQQQLVGIERRLAAMFDQRFEERFAAAERYFDRRFEERFAAAERHFDRRFEERFAAAERHFDQRFEESKRFFGVEAEGLRSDVRAVAEGHAVLVQRIDTLRDDNDRAHAEIIAMLRLSSRSVNARVDDLDARVRRLEER